MNNYDIVKQKRTLHIAPSQEDYGITLYTMPEQKGPQAADENAINLAAQNLLTAVGFGRNIHSAFMRDNGFQIDFDLGWVPEQFEKTIRENHALISSGVKLSNQQATVVFRNQEDARRVFDRLKWFLDVSAKDTGNNSSGTAGQRGSAGQSGRPGSAGQSGAAGAAGQFGTAGQSGTAGSAGQSGAAGATGSAGQSGAAGAAGSAGSSGTAGTAGSSGTAGTTGQSGTAGNSGQPGAGTGTHQTGNSSDWTNIKTDPPAARKNFTPILIILVLCIIGVVAWIKNHGGDDTGSGGSSDYSTASVEDTDNSYSDTDFQDQEDSDVEGTTAESVGTEATPAEFSVEDLSANSASIDGMADYFSLINSADLTQIGAQAAEEGSDLYITNIRPTYKATAGDEQEIAVIPWHSEWDRNIEEAWSLDIDWGMEFLDITTSQDGIYRSYEYEYHTYESVETIYNNWIRVEDRTYTELKELEIDGMQFSVFQGTTNGLTYAYAMQPRGEKSAFVCRVICREEEHQDMDELIRVALSGLEFKTSEFDQITAASPFSGRIITSEDRSTAIVVQRDLAYSLDKNEKFEESSDMTERVFWDMYSSNSNISLRHKYWPSGDDSYQYADRVEETIRYRLDEWGYEEFSEQSQRFESSDDYISDKKVGDLYTMNVNGYDVYARVLRYTYHYSDNSEQREMLHIGLQANDNTMVYITCRTENPLSNSEDDLEAIVQRLAGDNLQVYV